MSQQHLVKLWLKKRGVVIGVSICTYNQLQDSIDKVDKILKTVSCSANYHEHAQIISVTEYCFDSACWSGSRFFPKQADACTGLDYVVDHHSLQLKLAKEEDFCEEFRKKMAHAKSVLDEATYKWLPSRMNSRGRDGKGFAFKLSGNPRLCGEETIIVRCRAKDETEAREMINQRVNKLPEFCGYAIVEQVITDKAQIPARNTVNADLTLSQWDFYIYENIYFSVLYAEN